MGCIESAINRIRGSSQQSSNDANVPVLVPPSKGNNPPLSQPNQNVNIGESGHVSTNTPPNNVAEREESEFEQKHEERVAGIFGSEEMQFRQRCDVTEPQKLLNEIGVILKYFDVDKKWRKCGSAWSAAPNKIITAAHVLQGPNWDVVNVGPLPEIHHGEDSPLIYCPNWDRAIPYGLTTEELNQYQNVHCLKMIKFYTFNAWYKRMVKTTGMLKDIHGYWTQHTKKWAELKVRLNCHDAPDPPDPKTVTEYNWDTMDCLSKQLWDRYKIRRGAPWDIAIVEVDTTSGHQLNGFQIGNPKDPDYDGNKYSILGYPKNPLSDSGRRHEYTVEGKKNPNYKWPEQAVFIVPCAPGASGGIVIENMGSEPRAVGILIKAVVAAVPTDPPQLSIREFSNEKVNNIINAKLRDEPYIWESNDEDRVYYRWRETRINWQTIPAGFQSNTIPFMLYPSIQSNINSISIALLIIFVGMCLYAVFCLINGLITGILCSLNCLIFNKALKTKNKNKNDNIDCCDFMEIVCSG